MKVSGFYIVRHYRRGILLSERRGTNNVKDAGLTGLMNATLRTSARSEHWYCGLFSTITGTIPASKTTNDLSDGSTTLNTSISGAYYPEWSPAITTSTYIANATPMEFSITANGTIAGFYISDRRDKSAGAGTLWATVDFGSYNVESGDIFSVVYGTHLNNDSTYAGFTNSGLNKLLRYNFANHTENTKSKLWYIGLIKPVASDGTSVTADVNDTVSTHTGWSPVTEISGALQAWAVDAAGTPVDGKIWCLNPTPVTYTFTAPVKVGGFFIYDSTDKTMATSGTLLASKIYNTVTSFSSGDTINIFCPCFFQPA